MIPIHAQVDSITLPLKTLSNYRIGVQRIEPSYSLKLAPFFDRVEFNELCEKVNKIHRAYISRTTIVFIFSFLLCFTPLLSIFCKDGSFLQNFTIFGGIIIGMIFCIWGLGLLFYTNVYRKKEMEKLSVDYRRRFPGINLIYKVMVTHVSGNRQDKVQRDRFLEIEFPINTDIPTAPIIGYTSTQESYTPPPVVSNETNAKVNDEGTSLLYQTSDVKSTAVNMLPIVPNDQI
eukprot:TRINITY_DN778349_c0_g1_i1.p1 TRINITY_DN778349_c0_g1~~TRINITY_DN778349_c0_g1_i1.p1  ORF type:complete len:232 (+),score=27.14 TRINITY_DN778349_c0_g1_i1:61-756(+)